MPGQAGETAANRQPHCLTDRLRRRDRACGQRPVTRALHLLVQISVPQVVHRAACTAQQHRAGAKERKQA